MWYTQHFNLVTVVHIRHQQFPYVCFNQPRPLTSNLQMWRVLCHSISISLCKGKGLKLCTVKLRSTSLCVKQLNWWPECNIECNTTLTEYCTDYLHLCDCSAPQVRDGTAVYTGRPPVHWHCCYLATSQDWPPPAHQPRPRGTMCGWWNTGIRLYGWSNAHYT